MKSILPNFYESKLRNKTESKVGSHTGNHIAKRSEIKTRQNFIYFIILFIQRLVVLVPDHSLFTE